MSIHFRRKLHQTYSLIMAGSISSNSVAIIIHIFHAESISINDEDKRDNKTRYIYRKYSCKNGLAGFFIKRKIDERDQ